MSIASKIRSGQRELIVLGRYLLRGDYVRKYIYISHHKCATEYVKAILVEICRLKKIRVVKRDWKTPLTRADFLLNEFLVLSDYSSDILDIKAVEGKGFHVVRDPRDLLVSMYFSHRDTHPVNYTTNEIRHNREVLSQTNKEDGLSYLMEHSEYFKRITEEMGAWDYKDERFYETTFERLTTDPFGEFGKILHFIELGIVPDDLREILQRNNFRALRKRWADSHPDLEANHYRKGKPGDWKNHFSERNKKNFRQRFGDLLITLGYEQDQNL